MHVSQDIQNCTVLQILYLWIQDFRNADPYLVSPMCDSFQLGGYHLCFKHIKYIMHVCFCFS